MKADHCSWNEIVSKHSAKAAEHLALAVKQMLECREELKVNAEKEGLGDGHGLCAVVFTRQAQKLSRLIDDIRVEAVLLAGQEPADVETQATTEETAVA